jgi:hypothetical protein
MTIPGTLLVLLLAISFPTGVCCEGGLLSTLSANEWHNLPGGEKQAYVAGLIHGFDATKYFLYLSGRVAITEDTSKLSPKDALQFVEASFLMPELGTDYSFGDACTYMLKAIEEKYNRPLYSDQSLATVLRAVIQDIVRERLKD